MTTLPSVELGVLGPVQVRKNGAPVVIPGAKPRAILTMLGLHAGSVVSADTLLAILWADEPPRTADKALQTHISSLRRTLGDGVVLTQGSGWTLADADVDATRYKTAARSARDAAAAGDTSQAVTRFEEALTLWRGSPNCPTASAARQRRRAGSRGTPLWWRTARMHCSRRVARPRSSASWKPRWRRRRCARGVGAS
jgi:hypothetical protein